MFICGGEMAVYIRKLFYARFQVANHRKKANKNICVYSTNKDMLRRVKTLALQNRVPLSSFFTFLTLVFYQAEH